MSQSKQQHYDTLPTLINCGFLTIVRGLGADNAKRQPIGYLACIHIWGVQGIGTEPWRIYNGAVQHGSFRQARAIGPKITSLRRSGAGGTGPVPMEL